MSNPSWRILIRYFSPPNLSKAPKIVNRTSSFFLISGSYVLIMSSCSSRHLLHVLSGITIIMYPFILWTFHSFIKWKSFILKFEQNKSNRYSPLILSIDLFEEIFFSKIKKENIPTKRIKQIDKIIFVFFEISPFLKLQKVNNDAMQEAPLST